MPKTPGSFEFKIALLHGFCLQRGLRIVDQVIIAVVDPYSPKNRSRGRHPVASREWFVIPMIVRTVLEACVLVLYQRNDLCWIEHEAIQSSSFKRCDCEDMRWSRRFSVQMPYAHLENKGHTRCLLSCLSTITTAMRPPPSFVIQK